jgi:sulfite exporter TauE/SafE
MLATAFLFGLMGSLHCIGMCGPIAFMLPLDRNKVGLRYFQLGLYHLGRTFSYGLIGLVFGLVGKGLYLFGFQQKLSVVLGILMILSVLIPSRYLKGWGITRPLYRWIAKLQSSLGLQLKKRTPDTFLTIGLLNGFLPCGLVYMALIGAMESAAATQGALYMIAFGFGTLPLMSAAALFAKFVKGKWAKRIRKIIPILVVLIGLLFILRGLGLGIPFVSPKLKNEVQTTTLECHPEKTEIIPAKSQD